MTKKGWLIVCCIIALACMPYALFYGLLLYDLNASPYTDACIDDFFEAVEEEDHQAAMELLSTPLIEGQEQKEAISQAFSYVEGAFKSRKRIDSLYSISSMSKYDGEEQFTTYEVKTEEDRYYVAISIYASHGKVKGITSLSIIRADEWDALYPDHPYKGDYMRTPGVHVGALPS